MPEPIKFLDNITKHLTAAEREAREAAEVALLPNRHDVNLNPPPSIKSDTAAKRYWTATVARLEGLSLLDDLDSDALGILCSQLSRRDALSVLCHKLLTQAEKETDLNMRLEAVSRLDTLQGKLSTVEKSILQYQSALGLTPSGRGRLVRKQATERNEQSDRLFGD